jgi:hypothetical protein
MPVDKNELLDRKGRVGRQPDAGLQAINENHQRIIPGFQAADRDLEGKDVFSSADLFSGLI